MPGRAVEVENTSAARVSIPISKVYFKPASVTQNGEAVEKGVHEEVEVHIVTSSRVAR